MDVSSYVQWSESNDEPECYNKYKVLQIERRCLNDGFMIRNLNRSVRFEIACPEDHPLIHQFLLNEFGQQEPLNRSLGIKDEDLKEPLNNLLSNVLPQQMSIMVIDQGCLCGVITNAISTVNRELIKEPQIRSNYGSDNNQSSGVSAKLRIIYTILDELEAITPNFLPLNCLEYLQIDIISVCPEYAGCGIGKRLIIEVIKLAKFNGIRFCEATCTAVSSTKICQSLGMKSRFKLPYKDYRYLNQLVFPTKMHDGCEAANLMIGDLNEIRI